MSSSAVGAVKQAKPIISLSNAEARRRVLGLYRAWYRQVPEIVEMYDMPKTEAQCREQLRKEFKKHDHVKDIRVIDLLVIKGQMELKETANMWKNKGNLMNYFKQTWEPKPKDFMSKFLSGQD